MSGFLYFISGESGVRDGLLAELGLDELCEHGQTQRGAAGPDGEGGVIIAPKCVGGKAPRCGYWPDEQTWGQATHGRYWIGYETDAPPRPIDLTRKEIIGGHEIELGDGNKWQVPVARRFDGGTMLPQSLILGPDGELVTEALPRYAKFGRLAEKLFEQFQRDAQIQSGEAVVEDDLPEPITHDQLWATAVEALNLNYRVTGEEISILRLLRTSNVMLTCEAVLDVPTLQAILAAEQKKNAEGADDATNGSSSSTDGSEAS